ncbi:MAG: hypothetical protein JNL08_16470 [Planctomycetes bacterium]|nr:hypothetical protein [Planctomycetota bacterium]
MDWWLIGLASVALIVGVTLVWKAPTWAGARTAGVGFVLFGLATGSLAILRDVEVKTHNPVPVSDINQIGDADPESLVVGLDRAYFAANGTLNSTGVHEPSATPGIFMLRRHSHMVQRHDVGPLATKPSQLTVVPSQSTGEALLFAVGATLLLADGPCTEVRPATDGPLSAIFGLRADSAGTFMLGAPTAGRVQVYEVDLVGRTYRAVPGAVVEGDRATAFHACVAPSLLRSFVAANGADRSLWAWPGQGAPQRVPVKDLTLVHETPGGLLVSATTGGHARLSFVASATNVDQIEFEDIQQAPLVAVHACATWHGSEWLLASQATGTSLWRVAWGRLALVERLGSVVEPRLLTPIDGALCFVTSTKSLWLKLSTDDHNGVVPPNLADMPVPSMWSFGGKAVFTAKLADGHSTLCLWGMH